MTKKATDTAILVMTLTAVMIALTYVFTAFVNIRLPIAANGGLVHLGNVPLFIGAILFGKRVGAISGGVGMALFDLFSGWTSWAPFTLVIVAAMGYVVGLIAENSDSFIRYFLAIFAAMAIKVVGYYFAEMLLYQNAIAPLSSIPGNVVQVGVAGAIVLAIIVPLKKAQKKIMA